MGGSFTDHTHFMECTFYVEWVAMDGIGNGKLTEFTEWTI